MDSSSSGGVWMGEGISWACLISGGYEWEEHGGARGSDVVLFFFFVGGVRGVVKEEREGADGNTEWRGGRWWQWARGEGGDLTMRDWSIITLEILYIQNLFYWVEM